VRIRYNSRISLRDGRSPVALTTEGGCHIVPGIHQTPRFDCAISDQPTYVTRPGSGLNSDFEFWRHRGNLPAPSACHTWGARWDRSSDCIPLNVAEVCEPGWLLQRRSTTCLWRVGMTGNPIPGSHSYTPCRSLTQPPSHNINRTLRWPPALRTVHPHPARIYFIRYEGSRSETVVEMSLPLHPDQPIPQRPLNHGVFYDILLILPSRVRTGPTLTPPPCIHISASAACHCTFPTSRRSPLPRWQGQEVEITVILSERLQSCNTLVVGWARGRSHKPQPTQSVRIGVC